MTLEEARKELFEYHLRTKATHYYSSNSVLPILMEIKELMQEGDICILSKAHGCTAYHLVFGGLPTHPPTSGPFCSLGLAFPYALGVAFARPSSVVYLVTGDGEWDEGANHEAYWAMKRLNLSNIVVYVEQNGMQALKDVELDQVPDDPQIIKYATVKGDHWSCHYRNAQ